MKKTAVFFLLMIFHFSQLTLANGFKNDNPLEQKSTEQVQARPDIPGDLILDFGFSTMLDAPEQMDLRLLGSRGLNIYYYFNPNFNFEKRITFHPGFGLGFSNLMFQDDIIFNSRQTQESGYRVFLDSARNVDYLDNATVKKSKLAIGYFEVPLELRYHVNKLNPTQGFRFALGVKGGLRIDAHTKVKYEIDGDNRIIKQKEAFNLNAFRYSAYARFGFNTFQLFYQHNFAPMFQQDEGPGQGDFLSNMFGISLNLF
jgi:hypothetical protein